MIRREFPTQAADRGCQGTKPKIPGGGATPLRVVALLRAGPWRRSGRPSFRFEQVWGL